METAFIYVWYFKKKRILKMVVNQIRSFSPKWTHLYFSNVFGYVVMFFAMIWALYSKFCKFLKVGWKSVYNSKIRQFELFSYLWIKYLKLKIPMSISPMAWWLQINFTYLKHRKGNNTSYGISVLLR